MSDVTLSRWADQRQPELFVTERSEPEPVLLAYNLVAIVHDPSTARELLRKWERIQPVAAGVGFVAMAGSSAPREVPTSPTPPAVRKILRGALPGLLIGAVLLAVIAAVLDAGTGTIIGAALGGAALGFVAGGVAGFVAGTGWSEAYKESFVEPARADVVFASIHSDRIDLIMEAARVSELPGDTLLSIDRAGRPAPLDRGNESVDNR